jgi:1-deoxy-D-xylulose-5-phosphate reductoisomerase
MRLPISLALGWPDRVPTQGYGCDWTAATALEFEPLDEDAFPAVRLARTAGTAGGAAPAVYNGANEAAVEAFLAGNAPYLGIVDTVEAVLAEHLGSAAGPTDALTMGEDLTLEDVLAADAWARTRARELLGVVA